MVACYWTVSGPVVVHYGREWSTFGWRDRCANAARAGFSGLGLWHADIRHQLETGSTLDENRRHAVAAKLHDYTGLPVDYIEKANLRVYGGEFEKTLQDEQGVTTGRLDTRFSGPSPDPLDKDAQYDPQSAAISSAFP